MLVILEFFIVLEILWKLKKCLVSSCIEILFSLIFQELQSISKITNFFKSYAKYHLSKKTQAHSMVAC